VGLLAACSRGAPASRPAPEAEPAPEQAVVTAAAPPPALIVGEAAPRPAKPAPPATPAPPALITAPPDVHDSTLVARRAALIAGGALLSADEAGYYMDVHEARLRQAATAILRVNRSDARLLVVLPGHLTFTSGSADLTESGRDVLQRLARVFTDYDRTLISVHGYTDSTGSAELNLALSQSRAATVARQLISNGVDPARLVVVAHGAADPVADNTTEVGREANRRIALQIDPLRP
jgi:outer membrane protein OmpA-like peptidoglycan-associated protein